MTLEQFAELSAAIESCSETDDLLAAHGLTHRSWPAEMREVIAAIQREVESGRREISERYSSAYAAALSAPPRAKKPATAISMTGELDTRKLEEGLAAGGVPFQEPVAVPTAGFDVSRFRESEWSGPETARPPVTADVKRGTTLTTEGDSPPPRSLPFQTSNRDLMHLDRYAEMAAHLRARPADADAIMARFGLESREQRDQVHGLWRLRFEGNAALFARFTEAVEKKAAEILSKQSTDETNPRD